MKQNKHFIDLKLFFSTLFFAISLGSFAQEEPKPGNSAQELADKMANPVASLISVPLQNNLTYGIGAYNGSKYQINIQPVVPFKLSENLNLITRYILPVVDQQDVTGENTHEFGLSDATVTAFFAPKTKGIILGVGQCFFGANGYRETFRNRKIWNWTQRFGHASRKRTFYRFSSQSNLVCCRK
ncbi:hypothetical protein [Flavobacterium sp. MMS24-S5]|uniref:hypothetical protein n=1 Tax=Flavobacterium sp. MMS24-S5 TaxID=3416605 RepID=UPI003D00C67A